MLLDHRWWPSSSSRWSCVMLVVSGPAGPVDRRRQIGLGDQAVQVWNYRQVAGDRSSTVVIDRGDALLRHAQREAAEVPLDLGRRVRRDPHLAARPRPGSPSTSPTSLSYNKTYGSLAGVVVGLVFLWLTNMALLLGAEIDSELERGRQLQAGIAAEAELQLPGARHPQHREGRRKEAEDDAARGRRLRQRRGQAPPYRLIDNSHHHEETPS